MLAKAIPDYQALSQSDNTSESLLSCGKGCVISNTDKVEFMSTAIYFPGSQASGRGGEGGGRQGRKGELGEAGVLKEGSGRLALRLLSPRSKGEIQGWRVAL